MIAVGSLSAGRRRVAPVDPDEVRDLACSVTADADVCRVGDLPDIEPPPGLPATGTAGGLGVLGWLLVVVLIAAIAVALAWIVATWWRTRSAGTDAEPDDLDVDLDDEVSERIVDHERPPDTWRTAADRHRADGEYRDAVRCRYRALVGDLARAGYVDEVPGRTSGEERRQVAVLAVERGDADVLAVEFALAAELFDVAWFDDDEVSIDADDRFLAAERAVLDAVTSGSTGGGR